MRYSRQQRRNFNTLFGPGAHVVFEAFRKRYGIRVFIQKKRTASGSADQEGESRG